MHFEQTLFWANVYLKCLVFCFSAIGCGQQMSAALLVVYLRKSAVLVFSRHNVIILSCVDTLYRFNLDSGVIERAFVILLLKIESRLGLYKWKEYLYIIQTSQTNWDYLMRIVDSQASNKPQRRALKEIETEIGSFSNIYVQRSFQI